MWNWNTAHKNANEFCADAFATSRYKPESKILENQIVTKTHTHSHNQIDLPRNIRTVDSPDLSPLR